MQWRWKVKMAFLSLPISAISAQRERKGKLWI